MKAILIIGFLVFAAYGLYLWLSGKDPESVLDREIDRLKEENKDKAPIVYLRAFASESIQVSDIKGAVVGKTIPGTGAYYKDVGDTVTDCLKVIGPTVALARPDSTWRLRPWAPSRPELMSVDNNQWQQQILQWLQETALIVVQLDVSAGLGWELEQVVRKVRPIKVLLVLPSTQADYDQVREWANSFFPIPFPVELPTSRLMTFRPGWQPWPLPAAAGGGQIIWQILEPVFEQNGFKSPPWRRIYGFKSSN